MDKEEEISKLEDEYHKALKEFVEQEKQEDELTEERKEQLKKYVELMIEKGLCHVWAYYCKRCNYLWFPKDFIPFTPSTVEGGENIFKRIPPKACARCKSEYWNSLPQRKTKHTPDPKKGMYGHNMLTDKRMSGIKRIQKMHGFGRET